MKKLFIALFVSFLSIQLGFAVDEPVKGIKTEEKVFALTFDDGPDWGAFKMLEILNKNDAKATFFVRGGYIKDKMIGVMRKIVKAGHEIGNHSFSHKDMTKLSAEDMAKEIISAQEAVNKAADFTPVLFRAPSLKYSPELMAKLTELKMTPINASVYPNDWKKGITSEEIIETIKKTAKPGGIALMHSWCIPTLKALPEIIKYFKDNGYRLVTVSELLALQNK